MRLGVMVILAFSLAACGTVIDGDKAEKNLTKTLEGIGLEVKSVSCPSGMTPKKGDVFTCKVTAADGSKGEVKVREDDAKGNVTYVSDFLKQEQVEAGVKELVAKRAGSDDFTVTCPQLIPETKGSKVTCTAEDGTNKLDLIVTQNDDQGNYSVTGA